MMAEIWKEIKGYEGKYWTSNLGRIKSQNKILALMVNKKLGYYTVSLYKNKKSKTFYVHRLVAEAFIDNPFNLPQVNHIDCNKLNNCISNLEWVSHLDNQRHAWQNKLYEKVRTTSKENIKKARANIRNNEKKVKQYDKRGNFIKEWSSIKEAGKVLKLDGSAISKVCRKKLKSTGGYKWKYAE